LLEKQPIDFLDSAFVSELPEDIQMKICSGTKIIAKKKKGECCINNDIFK
jgi:hypothetical protein